MILTQSLLDISLLLNITADFHYFEHTSWKNFSARSRKMRHSAGRPTWLNRYDAFNFGEIAFCFNIHTLWRTLDTHHGTISKFVDILVCLYVCLYEVRRYQNFGLSHACHNVCADMIIQEWIFFSEPDFRLYSGGGHSEMAFRQRSKAGIGSIISNLFWS